MQYDKPIVTQPIKWGEDTFVDIKAKGDSLFITPIHKLDTTLKLEPVDSNVIVTTKPHVRLVNKNKGVVDAITEGGTFDITVALSEASPVDIVVDLSITNTGIADIQNNWRKSKDVHIADDTLDYVTTFFRLSADADYDNLLPQITIPAGDLEASTTITTVDDTLLTGGEGSFRVGKVELTSQDNPNYQLHHINKQGLILLEDANIFPLFSGELELWGRMGELAEYEPIDDPDTSATATLIYDWNMSDDGLVAESWGGRSKIIDDTPFDSIWFKFGTDNFLEDKDTVAPVDFTTLDTYVRFQIICGRRDK